MLNLVVRKETARLQKVKGQDPVSNKTVTDNRIVEQINSFHYLGNLIYYEKKWILITNNYLKITVIINSMFRPQKTLTDKIIQYTGPSSSFIW